MTRNHRKKDGILNTKYVRRIHNGYTLGQFFNGHTQREQDSSEGQTIQVCINDPSDINLHYTHRPYHPLPS